MALLGLTGGPLASAGDGCAIRGARSGSPGLFLVTVPEIRWEAALTAKAFRPSPILTERVRPLMQTA